MAETTLTVDSLDDEGYGVGTADGKEIRVIGVLPGETARVRIEHESPHAPKAWASLLQITSERSGERVPAACPGHGTCGGCVWQHLAYPAQLTEKRRRIERELAAHPSLANVKVDDVIASPRELHYRNKAKYVVAAAPRGRLTIGSFAPGTHRVIDMAGCQVPEEPIDAVARAALRLCEMQKVPPYDEAAHTGELRYLVVRANAARELLVVFVTTTGDSRTRLMGVAKALRAERREVVGVVLNVNATLGGAIFGDRDVPLDGATALGDVVGGVKLDLGARSFFQINRAQADRLYDEVARAAGARTGLRVVDLFTGVGGIALHLARKGAQVVGVEVLEAAVADARRSAVAAGLDGRAHFHAGYAATALPAAMRELGGVDVIVVNPPRKGLGADVKAVLAAGAPKIVYVSCGPKSLAADLVELTAGRYKVKTVRPFDLMPGTPHVETVVALQR